MRQSGTFIAGFSTGALVCLGVMSFQIVRAADGFHLVQKHHARLGQVYVDTREYGPADWADDPDLAAGLQAANKEYVMKGEPTGSLGSVFDRVAGRPQQQTH